MAGLEITPHRRAVLVSLHGQPRLGTLPLSYRQIGTILGVPKSTCGNIYKHALRNAEKKAAAKRQEDSAIRSLHREPEDVEVFLAGIDAQLDSLYMEPSQEVENDARR